VIISFGAVKATRIDDESITVDITFFGGPGINSLPCCIED
jgi:hypothetical protein